MSWLDRPVAASMLAMLCLAGCSSGFEDGDINDGAPPPAPSPAEPTTDQDGAEEPVGSTGESGSDDETGSTAFPGPTVDFPADELAAAYWRDLDEDKWDLWLDLIADDAPFAYLKEHWGVHPDAGRFPVTVTSGGSPAVDVPVALVDPDGTLVWQARTDVKGQAELFAGLYAPYDLPELSIRAGTTDSAVLTPTSAEASRTTIDLEEAPPTEHALDLMLVIDTTSSMDEELAYLQDRFSWLIEDLQADEALRVRTSVNFYRDQDEAYVVRSYPFTEDHQASLQALNAQSAQGGGDIPEAMDLALVAALENHSWSSSARSRVLVLVLDAPPRHADNNLARLHSAIETAARLGVRILPVASHRATQEPQFLLRFMEVATGGAHIRVLDPLANGDALPTFGELQPEPLDALLLRVLEASVTVSPQ